MPLKFGFFIFLFAFSANAQMFIPHTYWSCNSKDYDSKTISASSDFSAGTFSSTNVSGNSVVLSTGNSTGTYTSAVFDIFGGCSPLATWRKIDWKSTLPYGKEIPTTNEIATDYSAINTGLTTNLVELFHLNGSGAIANNAAVTAAVGTSGTASNANGTGMTYTASGKLASGITFDGTDDSIGIAYTQTSVSDYTIAAWFKLTNTGNNVILQDRGTGAGSSLTLGIGTNPGGCANGRISYGLDTNGIYIGICTTSAFNDGTWHHVVAVWDGTSGAAVAAAQFSIYVDGAAAATGSITVGTPPNAPLTGLGNTKIGRHDAWAVDFNGSLDEIAIWTRPLSATDATQVFQRGGNRIKFQIKTCTASDCSDIAAFKGPDNTSTTYFTELNNNTTQSTGLGSVLTTFPSMVFANFPSLTVAVNRFFQFQTTFETDNTSFMPDITSTSIYHGCPAGTVTFAASGTFVLPNLCTQMTLTVLGGGGASGRRTGGGTKVIGGVGGKAIKTFTGLTPLSQFTITIGSGGTCAGAAGTGAYAGGAGGVGGVGSPGTGASIGGAAGTGGAANGGLGKYGGGGSGAGSGPNDGAGGGAASSVVFSGTDWVVAGGGGASGGSQSGTPGFGGGSCTGAASGDNTLGGAGGNASAGSGAGGGGGGCYCLGGCAAASATGGSAGDASGTGCQTSNDGGIGFVQIDYQ